MAKIYLPPATVSDIPLCVARALQEDIGTGDITAQLIAPDKQARAVVISREDAIICGRPWVDEVFKQLDDTIELIWHVEEGESVPADSKVLSLIGNARMLLSGERAALNFLQTLSATATLARQYANHVEGTEVRILDTRKTIPGLRLAQKYAVTVGGCHNHRIGLYDAFLIKENHIAACGGISQAVAQARHIAADKLVEIEVENLQELRQALAAEADVVMLDNFSPEEIAQLTTMDLGHTKIEVSGNITDDTVKQYLSSVVSYISSGSLTKHIKAIDLSMRLI